MIARQSCSRYESFRGIFSEEVDFCSQIGGSQCTGNQTAYVNHRSQPNFLSVIIIRRQKMVSLSSAFAWPEPELGHEAASRFELEYLSGNSKASAIFRPGPPYLIGRFY